MKLRSFILFVLAVSLAACKGGRSQEYELWQDSPVDLTPVRERVSQALHNDSASIGDFFGADILEYDIPGSQSDWQIPDSGITDRFELEAIGRYNSYLAVHDIFSQYELFTRCKDMEYEVPAVSLMGNILSFGRTAANSGSGSPEFRSTIDTLATEMCKQIGEDAFGGRGNEDPTILLDHALELLSQTPFIDFEDETAIDWSVRTQLSWTDNYDTVLVTGISECQDNESCMNMFFDALQQAPDYSAQCALALGCVTSVASEFTLPAIQALLESGRYSEYNFILWLGWRSAMQYFYFGQSRDSRIADEYYNIQRKNAFLSTLDHLWDKPDDFCARLILEWLCSTGNIVRNGSNVYGTDAPLDYDMVFGR